MAITYEQYQPDFNLKREETVAIVGLVCDGLEHHETLEQAQRSMSELRSLLSTLEVPVFAEDFWQKRTKIDAGTLLGTGKIEEIGQKVKTHHVKALVFDVALSASQMRNIEKITGIKVIDRCHVIFQIFAQHARTKEAKIQIEIAKLHYMLPRLTALWTHFTRQKGGIGLKGEGEQQLELDRRIIKKKLAQYQKQLEELRISKVEQKKKRLQQTLILALVGHTNVGKSSLMNRLCKEQVLEENKLFATLDVTYRLLSPQTQPPLLMVDTVGLIANLPAPLVEGFQTTFSSVKDADGLVIVVDASDRYCAHHLSLTLESLKAVGADHLPKIFVFNKRDAMDPNLELKVRLLMHQHRPHYLVSSFDEQDMNSLRSSLIEFLLARQEHYDLFIPYTEGALHAKLRRMSNILTVHAYEQGYYYRIKTPSHLFHQLGVKDFLLSPEQLLSLYHE